MKIPLTLGLAALVALTACKERPPEAAAEEAVTPAPVRVERSEAPADAAEASEEAEATAPAVDVPAAPDGVAGIRPLLMAQHDDDVPGLEGLEAHPDPEAALRWMASYDDLMLVRARALDRLGLWDSDENAAFLLATLGDETVHDKARSAAILGLGRMDLDAREDARASLLVFAGGGNSRLAVEAIGVLGGVESAVPALESLAAREDLPEELRGALDAALQ